MFSQVYCTCCVKPCLSHSHKPWWKDGALGLFLFFSSGSLTVSNRHMNFLYPYLNPAIPPHLSNPISPWILSHTLDSLSVIQRCVFFKCLCAVDFELWMPQAPSRDLRGPAVSGLQSIISRLQPRRDRLPPSSTMLDSLDTSQVLTPSTGHWSPVLLGLQSDWVYVWRKDNMTLLQKSVV